MKIFVLGRPGCGKSRTSRRLVKAANKKNKTAKRINDYPILKRMFRADHQHKQFIPTSKFNGFDVIDFSVLDIALQELEQKALKELESQEIIVLEFARRDYRHALKQFNKEFFKDAYFLFIDVDVKTCIPRINIRVNKSTAHLSTKDDYYVSEEILNSYYSEQIFSRKMLFEFGIDPQQVWSISNEGTIFQFDRKIDQIIKLLLKQEQQNTQILMHSVSHNEFQGSIVSVKRSDKRNMRIFSFKKFFKYRAVLSNSRVLLI